MRLTALDPASAAMGLAIGMTLADARARMPRLRVATMDRGADDACLRRCAAANERFTPLVALDGRDGLILDITGCAHLFGGEAGLRAEALDRLDRAGFTVRATVAGTPDAAHALVRFGSVAIVAPGEEARAVAGLPVAALEAGTETSIALVRAGLKTLGDLAVRPTRILSARFGSDPAERLERILGRHDIRITPLRAPPDCMAERHFPEPMTALPALEEVLERLAGDVCAAMERRGAGGRRFAVDLFRCDGVVRRLAVETSAPCRDVAAIMRLVGMRIETLADPLDPGFGFDAMRLSVSSLDVFGAVQVSLDGRAVDDGAISDLVDRLIVRFGRERVLRFVAGDTHDPVRAGRVEPILAASTSAPVAAPVPEPGEPPLRPLQLFARPQPIETLAEVPDGPPLRFRWRRVLHEIARSEGPERIAPEWWLHGDPAPATRDYYRIEDTFGRRFWVFREGMHGEGTPPRWYVHGLFA